MRVGPSWDPGLGRSGRAVEGLDSMLFMRVAMSMLGLWCD